MASGIVRAAMLTSLFLVHCSPPQSSHDGESDADDSGSEDTLGDSDSDAQTDPDASDSSPDDAGDTAVDPGSDDTAADPYPDIEGFIDMVPIPPGHAPTDCGVGCRQVTFAERAFFGKFEVWGDFLAFATYQIYDTYSFQGIYLVDLVTLDTFLVIETDSSDDNTPMSGSIALWSDELVFAFHHRTPDRRWWLFRLLIPDGRIDLLWAFPTSLNYAFTDMRMHGDIVAWSDNRTSMTGDGNFYYFDTVTENEVPISTEPCFVCGSYGVDLWDNNIVFHGDDGGDDWIHLFVHDVETGVTSKITTGNWDHFKPSIWGSTVVWTDMRNGGTAGTQSYADVYMYDLATGTETVVCDHPASQPSKASVWGDRIAWRDLRNDPLRPNEPSSVSIVDIYYLDIPTRMETRVDLPTGWKGSIHLTEGKLYFVMKDDSGFYNIFEKILE